jgi:hypothetical protein
VQNPRHSAATADRAIYRRNVVIATISVFTTGTSAFRKHVRGVVGGFTTLKPPSPILPIDHNQNASKMYFIIPPQHRSRAITNRLGYAFGLRVLRAVAPFIRNPVRGSTCKPPHAKCRKAHLASRPPTQSARLSSEEAVIRSSPGTGAPYLFAQRIIL